ncbi:MAG: flagellar hook protein FlgE [Firmicutes bacterium]|mgnify:CR=1 FL=1|jgi:flagellar hook protein FlgE|nr:flagellar hook protein FlgE [Bacillota bacterium]
MMRSMFAGVSASRAHQAWMDVIGNNIANVNTTAFKNGRVTFEEVLVQTLRGGSAPVQGGRGGINPMQVGLGISVNSIDIDHTQGNTQPTEVPSDLAIDGAGFFILSDGETTCFTRNGSFRISPDGSLVSTEGYRVQGRQANPDTGVIDRTRPIGDIKILLGQVMEVSPTKNVSLRGNLDSLTIENETVSAPFHIYDSLGQIHLMTISFTKTGTDNEWNWELTEEGIDDPIGTGEITFTQSGKCNTPETAISFTPTGGAEEQTFSIDFSWITQFSESSMVSLSSQDGFQAGTLEIFNIDASGIITGIYSNGQQKVLGQIELATFSNPPGLLRLGGGLYQVSPNSGVMNSGEPGVHGKGKIISGALEMSNVDLAKQFTDMIISQRGFQANSRVITTADEMLQDLLTLKR